MPFRFALIPEHIRLSTVQKQRVRDFVAFHKCSRESYEVSKKVKTRFTLVHFYPFGTFLKSREIPGEYYFPMMSHSKMNHIYLSDLSNSPIRLQYKELYYDGVFATEECAWLTKIVLNTGTNIKTLSLSSIECPPESLNELLIAAKVETLSLNDPLSLELLSSPVMQQINLQLCHASGLKDENLLSLGLESLLLLGGHNITTTGINTFLKKWQRNERCFTNLTITMDQEMKIEEILNGLNYVTVENTNPPRYELKNDNNEVIIVNFESNRNECHLEMGRWIHSDNMRDDGFDSDDYSDDDE